MEHDKLKKILKKIKILKKRTQLMSISQKNSPDKNILKKVVTSLRKVVVFLEKNN